MRIDELETRGIEPLTGAKGSIQFARGLNVIRGANGSGKTTLLEVCALLGHAPVLKFRQDETPDKYAKLRVSLSSSEAAWLNQLAISVRKALRGDSDGGSREETAVFVKFVSEEVKRLWPSAETDRTLLCFASHVSKDKPYTITFSPVPGAGSEPRPEAIEEFRSSMEKERSTAFKALADPEEGQTGQTWEDRLIAAEDMISAQRILDILSSPRAPSLKECLASEQLLSAFWSITWTKKEEIFDALALKALVHFSRPHPNPLNTPRRSYIEKRGIPPVGFVSYFNTDMYEFGIGLDIRESPKDFTKNFTDMLRRLYVPHDNIEGGRSIGSGGEFSELFARIIKNKEIASICLDDRGQPKLLNSSGNRVRTIASDGAPLSSGENQVFFLALVLVTLNPENSILLLDEADLHLAVPSVDLLIEELRNVAATKKCQIIMITHMPLVSNRHLRRREKEKNRWLYEKEDQDADRKVALYYFDHSEDVVFAGEAAQKLQEDYFKAVDWIQDQHADREATYRIEASRLMSGICSLWRKRSDKNGEEA